VSTGGSSRWLVMPGLVPGIHVFLLCCVKDVDGRDRPGHDELERSVPAFLQFLRRK
jgi:hypothetical protein